MKKQLISAPVTSTDPGSSVYEKPWAPLAREAQTDGPKAWSSSHADYQL